jgi:aminopeptidase N
MSKITKAKLTLDEAVGRKNILSKTDDKGNQDYKIHYDIYLSLRKGNDKHISYENEIGFEGVSKITTYVNKFGTDEHQKNLLIDFHGTVVCVIVNGKLVEHKVTVGKLYLEPKCFVEESTNTIEVYYHAKYNRSGNALHWFRDPSDQKEYLYTQFEAFECNLAVPSFDQPDLKATMTMNLIAFSDWTVLSNENALKSELLEDVNKKEYGLSEYAITVFDELSLFKNPKLNEQASFADHLVSSVKSKNYKITKFETTPIISTYLYALAAGEYYCHKNKKDFRIPMNVYMRVVL